MLLLYIYIVYIYFLPYILSFLLTVSLFNRTKNYTLDVFLPFFLHMSKKSCTFAADLRITLIVNNKTTK